MDGKATSDIVERAKAAAFDERLSLLGLLLDGVVGELSNICEREQVLTEMLASLKAVRVGLARAGADAKELLEKQCAELSERATKGRLSSSISSETAKVLMTASAELGYFAKVVAEVSPKDGNAAFALIKAEFDKQTKELKKLAADSGKKLENAFVFCEKAFGDGQEMLIFVTELTISYYGAHFISRYGCQKYFEHNKELLFYERQKELIREIEKLDLED